MKVVAVSSRGIGSSLIMKFTLRDVLKCLNRPDLKPGFATPKSFKGKNVYVAVCDRSVGKQIDFDRKIIMKNLFDRRELEEKLSAFLAQNDPHIQRQI